MSANTDWFALARAKMPEIPEASVAKNAPALDSLVDSFRPLLAGLEHFTEPALILSESALTGVGGDEK